MEITFELIDGLYTAEFEVKSNCNIHVEREGKGDFFILQRGTKTGKYAVVSEEDYNKTTIDVDMLGNIYPKYIKVTSTSMPTYAEVNFAEQGGGSGGGEVDPNSVDYVAYVDGSVVIDMPEVMNYAMNAQYVKFKNPVNNNLLIMSTFMAANTPEVESFVIRGLCFMPNVPTCFDVEAGVMISFKDALTEIGIDFNSFPFITKEEFFNLEA